MVFSKILLLTILLSFNFACGKKSSSSGNKRETSITEEQIQEVMNHQVFECASLGGNCPSGITRLLIINKADTERSAVCSGFMISATRLITNHHCVATAEECANTYLAIYNGANYEQKRCKQIIKSEQDAEDPNDPTRKIDYTVMETDNAFLGEVLNLSEDLASEGEIIHTWVIDHTGLDQVPVNLLDSRITELKCQVDDQTERESLVMKKCPIISGNSGSPALNTKGEVVGVIWGGSATIVDSSDDLEWRRSLDALGLATEVNYFRGQQ